MVTEGAAPTPSTGLRAGLLALSNSRTGSGTAEAAEVAEADEVGEVGKVGGAASPSVTPLTSDRSFMGAVAHTVRDIRHGELRKVVLARQIELAFDRAIDVPALLRRWHDVEPTATVFSIPVEGGQFLGASPELLVDRRGATVRCRPLAGTSSRPGKGSTGAGHPIGGSRPTGTDQVTREILRCRQTISESRPRTSVSTAWWSRPSPTPLARCAPISTSRRPPTSSTSTMCPISAPASPAPWRPACRACPPSSGWWPRCTRRLQWVGSHGDRRSSPSPSSSLPAALTMPGRWDGWMYTVTDDGWWVSERRRSLVGMLVSLRASASSSDPIQPQSFWRPTGSSPRCSMLWRRANICLWLTRPSRCRSDRSA